MNLDFDKYKNSLKNYLSAKGIDISQNPTWCINPDHQNTKDPAMQLHDDGFKCHSCGCFGDIYDAAGLICGIADKKDQYKEVETTLGFAPVTGAVKKKEEPAIDPEAKKQLDFYLRNHGGRKQGVLNFLHQRGYPESVIPALVSKYAYWPGMDIASQTIPLETLEKAGIPIPTKDKNYSSWHYSGVVVRLGQGYKLMYYKEGKCEKRNSTGAKTFPCPPVKELPKELILTEAETSALSMRAAGFNNVFSTGGTNGITKYNADQFKDVEKIIFAFDGDNKGRYYSGLDPQLLNGKTGEPIKAKTAVEKLRLGGCNAAIYTARLAENSDPDDYIQDGKTEELKNCIEQSVKLEDVPDIPDTPPEDPEQPEERELLPFRFMGYDDKSYYILPQNQNVSLKINRGDNSLKNWMNEGASEEWWFDRFNTEIETKEGELKTVFDKSAAMKWFRDESYKVGIYDATRLKGIGAYMDEGQLVLNTGRGVKIANGDFINYQDWNGENIFTRSKRHFRLQAEPWTMAQGRNLWNQVNTFTFEKRMDKIAVCGYMVLAPFSSALWRRPSIWITAKKGTGKSYLMEELIVPAVGGRDFALFTEGSATEAFLRQMTKTDSIPIVIDEFEAKDKKEKMNNERIQDLMRSAYGGSTTGKGSASHEAIEFHLRNMFCFGSINVNISNDGNRSRIHICRMAQSKGVCQAPDDFEGLRARTFLMLPKIMEDIKIAKEKVMKLGLNNRIGDTYAPFLAGTWNLVSEEPFMSGNDENILRVFGEAIEELLGNESKEDEDRIIERIVQQRIRIDSSNERTVAEMLTERQNDIPNGKLLYVKELQRYGIKRVKYQGNEVLAFALDSTELSKMLEDTPFADYREIIQRNKFLLNESYPVRMAGTQTRCVLLDWGKFETEYLGKDEEDDDLSENLPAFA